jgi:hypothetical protein
LLGRANRVARPSRNVGCAAWQSLIVLLACPTPKALTSTSSLTAPILFRLALYRRCRRVIDRRGPGRSFGPSGSPAKFMCRSRRPRCWLWLDHDYGYHVCEILASKTARTDRIDPPRRHRPGGAGVRFCMAQACRFSQRFGLRLGGYSCQNGFCASSNTSRRVSRISTRSRSLRRCNANRDQTRSRQPSNSDRSLH